MGPLRASKKRKHSEKKFEVTEERSEEWWDGFSKRINGLVSLSRKDLDGFKSIFKISRSTFDYICSLVRDKAGNFSFTNGNPLSLNDQVAVALRRLSSGESLMTIADAFGLSHSTVSQVTWNFVEAMEERALHHLQWPSSEPEMSQIKTKFEKICGLPNCCGAIDTTHVVINMPLGDRSSKAWLDRETNHSMILQAIVDPDMRFRDVVTGWPGQVDDSMALRSSSFFELCEKGKRLAGKKMELAGGSELREYIVGDSGFPLLSWLVTPYQGKDAREATSRVEFNRRHYKTRKVARKALARLKERWRIIRGVMWRPDKHRLPRVILVCCLLHNIVIDLEGHQLEEEGVTLSHRHDPGYRKQVCESVDMAGLLQRERLSRYFIA